MAGESHPCDGKPLPMDMEPGVYFWCSCGLTSFPPFCDGSHKGSGFQPVRLELTEPRRVWWCQCRRTQSPPLCDGSHKGPADG